MADSILKIRTQDGDKPISYQGLADKPVANKELDTEEAFADAKAVGDALKKVNETTDSLKEDLDEITKATVNIAKTTNLYNESNSEEGYRIAGDGSKVAQEGSILSDYIEIPNGATYAIPCAYFNGGYKIFCYSHGFYNSGKGNISGSGAATASAISIPKDAKYFRCSWLIGTTSQRFIGFNTNGSIIPYEEYYEPKIEIKTNSNVTEKLKNHENKITASEEKIAALEIAVDRSEVTSVMCWGDSLTDGAGASDTSHQYPSVLKALINANNAGITTSSAGIGGEGTYSIAARQGGVVVNVKPCTIPPSGSVNIEIDKWNGLSIPLCRRGGVNVTSNVDKMKLNPCIINGIGGTLLRDSTGNYVFTRTTDGEEVTFERPVPLLTYGHEILNDKGQVGVIWSGTNDIASNGGTIEKTIQGINMMIAKLQSKKYIIVGLTSKTYHSDIEEKNFRLATEYKDHFVNIRDYMLAYGLDDSGIEATEQDLADIKNGEIPTSLRVDAVHGNDYFYNIVANLVYKKGKELEYWN